MELLGLPSCISAGVRFISGRTSEHFCSGFAEFKMDGDVIRGLAGQARLVVEMVSGAGLAAISATIAAIAAGAAAVIDEVKMV